MNGTGSAAMTIIGHPVRLFKNDSSKVFLMKKPCQCTFVVEHQGEIESFEHQKELFRLKAKLHAAEKQRMSGREGISLDESRARLRKIYE